MSQYRISGATWNGGLHPGYCCHCGMRNVHSSGPGLLCDDCFNIVRRYDNDGAPVSEEIERHPAIRPGGVYKVLGVERRVTAVRHTTGDDFFTIHVNHDADDTSWHENPV